MGVPGLFDLMGPAMEQTIDLAKPEDRAKLGGNKALVDVSGWIYRGGEYYVYREVMRLVEFGIRPILVFDGKSPEAKKETKEKRTAAKASEEKAKKSREQGDKVAEAIHLYRAGLERKNVIANIKHFCKLRGVPYAQSPNEADPQIVSMLRKKIGDFVISNDTDFILYGCDKILYRLNGDNGVLYDKSKFAKCFDDKPFDEDIIQALCILSGCDYLPSGVFDFGIQKIKEFYPQLKPPFRFYQMVDLVEQAYPRFQELSTTKFREAFLEAFFTFKYQRIYDTVEKKPDSLTPYDELVGPWAFPYAGNLEDAELAEYYEGRDIIDVPKIRRPLLNPRPCELLYCQNCTDAYITHDELMAHRLEKHCTCDVCGKVFRFPNELERHKPHHTDEKYPCVICGGEFDTPYKLQIHKRDMHNDGYGTFECAACKKTFATHGSLQDHSKTCKVAHPPKQKKYQCPQCPWSFDTPWPLKVHIGKVHSEAKLPCDKCNEKFRTGMELLQHRHRAHGIVKQRKKPNDPTNPHECPLCGNRFSETCSLYKHIRTQHPDDVDKPAIQQLLKGKKTTNPDNPYPCKFSGCEQRFSSKNCMHRHFRNKHKKNGPTP